MSTAAVRNSCYSLWNLLLRPFFAHLPLNARIHPLSVFKGRQRITIGPWSKIGAYTRITAEEPQASIKIGARCQISPFAMLITCGGTIELGDDCSINPFSILYGHGGLQIGHGVRIASGSVIIPADHNFDDTTKPIHEQGTSRKGVVIEDDVWIAANVTVLDGIRIGRGSVIAAGAVVTKEVEPLSIMGGVPARLIKKRAASTTKHAPPEAASS